MQAACNGTDERLDELIALNKRAVEQLGQIIDLGIEAVAAIKALAPVEPGEDRQIKREAVELQEPARKRKRT